LRCAGIAEAASSGWQRPTSARWTEGTAFAGEADDGLAAQVRGAQGVDFLVPDGRATPALVALGLGGPRPVLGDFPLEVPTEFAGGCEGLLRLRRVDSGAGGRRQVDPAALMRRLVCWVRPGLRWLTFIRRRESPVFPMYARVGLAALPIWSGATDPAGR
jgi:hypothetical protein